MPLKIHIPERGTGKLLTPTALAKSACSALQHQKRTFPIAAPQDGGAIAGSGGVVSWQAGEKIARYSVEVVGSGGSWAQPTHRFGTSGTSVALQGVSPGTYDIRVGAFSEVSGRWEWQYIRNVSVQ